MSNAISLVYTVQSIVNIFKTLHNNVNYRKHGAIVGFVAKTASSFVQYFLFKKLTNLVFIIFQRFLKRAKAV